MLLCLLFLVPNFVQGQEQESLKLAQWAADLTGTLSPYELSNLNQKLKELDDSTSTQVVVVIVATLSGRPIEEVALEIAEANRVGRKGKDNGVLLLIAKDDREIRIEVGYGLEGVLTDALAGQIVRREITPWFRQGDYNAGVNAGVDAIILAVRNEYAAEPDNEMQQFTPGILLFLFFIVFFGISTFGRRNRFRGGPRGPIFHTGMGGGSSPFGGFGEGGFSGGGGSFGGGGASGRW